MIHINDLLEDLIARDNGRHVSPVYNWHNNNIPPLGYRCTYVTQKLQWISFSFPTAAFLAQNYNPKFWFQMKNQQMLFSTATGWKLHLSGQPAILSYSRSDMKYHMNLAYCCLKSGTINKYLCSTTSVYISCIHSVTVAVCRRDIQPTCHKCQIPGGLPSQAFETELVIRITNDSFTMHLSWYCLISYPRGMPPWMLPDCTNQSQHI